MTLRKKLLGAVAGIAALVGGYAAYAQYSLPIVFPNAGDAVQVLPFQLPAAGNKYASVGSAAGTWTYVNGGAQTTGFSVTFVNGQVSYFIQPAGTLATGTLTTEPNPGDGKRECFLSTQTQTALTWTANTGQTIASSVPASGVANSPRCIQYSSATATWYSAP